MHRQKIESEEQGVEPPLLPYSPSPRSVHFSVPSVPLWLALFILLLLCPAALAAEARGVVVSVSPPADRVGERILAKGGNAVDAAVAVGFALAVTWPEAGNIAGGGFMLVRPAGPKSVPVVIDYRETAPASATKDLFAKGIGSAHRTVGVPGSVLGLATAHAKFGKLPWKDLVGPAVKLAAEGFAVEDALEFGERLRSLQTAIQRFREGVIDCEPLFGEFHRRSDEILPG